MFLCSKSEWRQPRYTKTLHNRKRHHLNISRGSLQEVLIAEISRKGKLNMQFYIFRLILMNCLRHLKNLIGKFGLSFYLEAVSWPNRFYDGYRKSYETDLSKWKPHVIGAFLREYRVSFHPHGNEAYFLFDFLTQGSENVEKVIKMGVDFFLLQNNNLVPELPGQRLWSKWSSTQL